MKKSIIMALIISFAITLICFIVNIICAYRYDSLPISKEYPGGEIIEKVGFGVNYSKIYVFTYIGDNTIGNSSYVKIDFVNLILSYIVTFICTFIIMIFYYFVIRKVFINKKN